MPATWGFGNAGTEPGTMTGWGYPTDLETIVLPSAIYKAEEIPTSYNAEEIETSYTAKTDEE